MRMTKRELPVAFAGILLLVIRLGLVYMRLQVRSKRAERVFRKHLVRGGMHPEQARQLAADYRSISSLRRILGANRVAIPFLH